jgi:hypothetical protein
MFVTRTGKRPIQFLYHIAKWTRIDRGGAGVGGSAGPDPPSLGQGLLWVCCKSGEKKLSDPPYALWLCVDA